MAAQADNAKKQKSKPVITLPQKKQTQKKETAEKRNRKKFSGKEIRSAAESIERSYEG